MRLSDAAGSAFQLAVTGYQFPDATLPDKKYSWHMLEGAATFGGESWPLRFPALTCDETPRVSAWLRRVADWIDAADAEDGHAALMPTPLTFIEPCLAVRLVPAREPDLAVLEIQLRLNFRRPSHLKAPMPLDALPITASADKPPDDWHIATGANELPFDALRITASADQLRTAAADWDAERAPYPDGLA